MSFSLLLSMTNAYKRFIGLIPYTDLIIKIIWVDKIKSRFFLPLVNLLKVSCKLLTSFFKESQVL